MATVASDNKRRKVKGVHQAWPCASNATINQGDLIYLDTTNHVVTPLDTDAHAAYLVGVAEETFPVTSLGTGDGYNRVASVQVGWGDVFAFKMTSGDTYHDGDAVYIGADAQTVTNTAGAMTHPIGVVRLPVGMTSLAYAAGQTVDVYINTVTAYT